jgi:hypothetical protein
MGKELRGNFRATGWARKCKLLHIIGNRDGLPECHSRPKPTTGKGFGGIGTALEIAPADPGRETRIPHLNPGAFPGPLLRGSSRSHFRRRPERVKIKQDFVVPHCQMF